MLSQYVAQKKRKLLEELLAGGLPSEGNYDKDLLERLRSKGRVQLGTAVFEPEKLTLEFIFVFGGVTEGVLNIDLDPPERIVFMPVPEWVVEEVWQGQVDGSYHFESDANKLIDSYKDKLQPMLNKSLFEKRKPIGRS